MKIKGPFPQSRHDIGHFLNTMGLIGEGAEIGVLRGSFSQIIMGSWHGKMLHLIDPLCRQEPGAYNEATNETEDWNRNFIEVSDRVQSFGGRAMLHRKLSEEAVLEFNDGQLDWVFIDANHDYEHVKSDLNLWYPKLKSGGLLSGHDYGPYREGDSCEVKRAVDEFVDQNNLIISGVTSDESFWIWKP